MCRRDKWHRRRELPTSPQAPLKKFVPFYENCPDIPKPQQLVQKSSGMCSGTSCRLARVSLAKRVNRVLLFLPFSTLLLLLLLHHHGATTRGTGCRDCGPLNHYRLYSWLVMPTLFNQIQSFQQCVEFVVLRFILRFGTRWAWWLARTWRQRRYDQHWFYGR